MGRMEGSMHLLYPNNRLGSLERGRTVAKCTCRGEREERREKREKRDMSQQTAI